MASIPKGKAKGQRGEWFAAVSVAGAPDEWLPCVHDYWFTGTEYDDPYAAPGEPKWDEFIDAIQNGRRVIMTRDEPVPGSPTHVFHRRGYIAVFEIEGAVTVEEGHLRFRIGRRVINS